MMTKYNTNLASEFYVLSMLYRLGLDASLTLGNKKAVDIVVSNEDRTFTTVEVKGIEKKYDWPANNIHEEQNPQHFYVLVSFEGKITDPLLAPSAWIIPALKIKEFLRSYRSRIVVSRAAIKSRGKEYLHAWRLLIGDNGQK